MLTAKVQKHRQKKKQQQSKPKQQQNTSFDQDYTPPTRSCTKRSIEEQNTGPDKQRTCQENSQGTTVSYIKIYIIAK